MDEVATQPINGLTVKGVTFADTATAFYNASNGGQLTYVQDPAIVGSTFGETITITFPGAVTDVSFGLALSPQISSEARALLPISRAPVSLSFTPGALVQLFGPAGNSLGIFPLNVLPIPGDAFPNSLFSSNLVIAKAVIAFPAAVQNAVPPLAFALDNLAFTVAAAAEVESVYQLRYLANLDKGDSYINLTNAGTLAGFDPAGRICVNVYTFDPAEELISCCACPVTPNGLNSLSARNDLIGNTLTPGVPTSITVKLVSSLPLPGNTCNPASVSAANLVRGGRAWASTLHLNTSGSPAVGYQQTETPFSSAELSATELAKLTGFCGFIQANGSGFGICKACRFGTLGAGQK